jgi:hypothetical protein
MFCPSCKDEFRRGFTRCASCNVDLVDDLDAEVAETKTEPRRSARPSSPMVEYCGFFDLDEAREARDRLRDESIGADILIRDAEGDSGDTGEEYWLRVESARYAHVPAILGFDATEAGGDDDASSEPIPGGGGGRFAAKLIAPATPDRVAEERASGEHVRCSECGKRVAVQESFCPHCGLRFED